MHQNDVHLSSPLLVITVRIHVRACLPHLVTGVVVV